MWYERLQVFLVSHFFVNKSTLPCIFIYRKEKEFVIVAAYVNDLNLIGTQQAIMYVCSLLTGGIRNEVSRTDHLVFRPPN